MFDLQAADAHVYAKVNVAAVTNIATGGVFQETAPQGTVHPIVLIRPAGILDEWSSQNKRMMGVFDLIVVGVVEGFFYNYTLAEKIDDALKAAASVQGSGAASFPTYSQRVRGFRRSYEIDGKSYCECGGVYRVWSASPI